MTARDVLLNSDIIFICLSDNEVTRRIIESEFHAFSETENILQDKMILVMSRIKPETSVIFSEKITSQKGKYLELAFQGNIRDITERSITLFTAGDESLFNLCQPYFKAISKASYFFNTAGTGLKMNLILQMMKAVNLGALAEGMSLTQKLGIPFEIFLEIFAGTEINSSFLKNKATAIIKETFVSVEQPLQKMQAELRDVLDISFQLDQSIPLTNMAHEVFKDCKRLQYGSSDVSAIYLKYKNY
ncbi:cytokine-like nuclear factor N-PAC [Diorhabda carinulata]|uniref:cytokine-like nuclear factor N-PAC n=1 Tax=Diorhabda carinulata TaxID=1163345 RepID=UPI0025A0F65C|nr:cytokine-like nuclear factor N-PAC [Diorhabda carinulata]